MVPYSHITNDSVNSADGMEAFHWPTTARDGLTFHAHPKSAKQPIHRPRVNNPYQKKMPPLMEWASPLNIYLPRYDRLAFTEQRDFGSGIAYEDASVRHSTSCDSDEAEN